jgi:hypothetical protein
MSTLSVATIKSQNTLPPAVQNSSGTEIGTFCRAWVNFNGTGTVAIRASFNVSSITDGGVGSYTVNFTTAMSDANYAVPMSAEGSGSSGPLIAAPTISGTYTTSAVTINTMNYSGNNTDSQKVSVAIFR